MTESSFLDINQNKYDCKDDLNYLDVFPKGLSKDVVIKLSKIKNEPEWMLNFSNEFKEEIKSSASKLNTHFDTHREIQYLLNISRNEKFVCQVHKLLDKQFDNCNVCFDKVRFKK